MEGKQKLIIATNEHQLLFSSKFFLEINYYFITLSHANTNIL